jgi:hypothetical protein
LLLTQFQDALGMSLWIGEGLTRGYNMNDYTFNNITMTDGQNMPKELGERPTKLARLNLGNGMIYDREANVLTIPAKKDEDEAGLA